LTSSYTWKRKKGSKRSKELLREVKEKFGRGGTARKMTLWQ